MPKIHTAVRLSVVVCGFVAGNLFAQGVLGETDSLLAQYGEELKQLPPGYKFSDADLWKNEFTDNSPDRKTLPDGTPCPTAKEVETLIKNYGAQVVEAKNGANFVARAGTVNVLHFTESGLNRVVVCAHKKPLLTRGLSKFGDEIRAPFGVDQFANLHGAGGINIFFANNGAPAQERTLWHFKSFKFTCGAQPTEVAAREKVAPIYEKLTQITAQIAAINGVKRGLLWGDVREQKNAGNGSRNSATNNNGNNGDNGGGGLVGNPTGQKSELEQFSHWFPGPRKIDAQFCVERSNDYPKTKAELEKIVQWAYDTWNEKIESHPDAFTLRYKPGLAPEDLRDRNKRQVLHKGEIKYFIDPALIGEAAKTFVTYDPRNPKAFYISPKIKIKARANCENIDPATEYVIPFYFGVKPPQMSEETYARRQIKDDASAEPGTYNDKELYMENAYVWFSGPKDIQFVDHDTIKPYHISWKEPLLTEMAVLHEVGHIFGNSHGKEDPEKCIDGTIMESDIIRKRIKAQLGLYKLEPLYCDHLIIRKNERTGDLVPRIDQTRILFTPTEPERDFIVFKIVGAMGDLFGSRESQVSIFKLLTKKEPKGKIVIGGSFNGIILQDRERDYQFNFLQKAGDDVTNLVDPGHSFIVNTGAEKKWDRYQTSVRVMEFESHRVLVPIDQNNRPAGDEIHVTFYVNKANTKVGRPIAAAFMVELDVPDGAPAPRIFTSYSAGYEVRK